MFRQTRERDIALFLRLGNVARPRNQAEVPTYVLVPAFMISELTTAFKIGILLFIPFIVIDLVVASTLMSMGIIFFPPVFISMPLKIILFHRHRRVAPAHLSADHSFSDVKGTRRVHMSVGFVANLMSQAIFETLIISAPMLGLGLIVGLVVSIFQATTSIQEQTLTFVPKIVVVLGSSHRFRVLDHEQPYQFHDEDIRFHPGHGAVERSMDFFVMNFQVFLLILVRVFGMFVVAPFFSSDVVPARIRVITAVYVTACAFPMAARYFGRVPESMFSYAMLVGSEALIGILIGFMMSIIFAAFQLAATFFSFQMAIGIAEVLDPVLRDGGLGRRTALDSHGDHGVHRDRRARDACHGHDRQLQNGEDPVPRRTGRDRDEGPSSTPSARCSSFA